MFEHKLLINLNDFFLELNNRKEKGVYFYRICGYNAQIEEFIKKYYDYAKKTGVVIEGKIPNPDEKNLEYYSEIMGMDFQMDVGFFISSLQKWLPRMNAYQRENVATAMYDSLDGMRLEGKNENMMKNAYIKFMCWLYYKFERIVNSLGGNNIPKIIYEGDISNYELKMLQILSNAGCDIILLQYNGDESYLKLDAESNISAKLKTNDMTDFPKDFSLKKLEDDIEKNVNMERMYGVMPKYINCTNAWIKGNGLDDFKTGVTARGTDANLFYNCFYRINGVEDKLTYLNDLYQFQREIKNSGRNLLILEKSIDIPTMDEISSIRRRQYRDINEMVTDLSLNIKYSANIELQRIMNKAFIDIMLEESEKAEMNVNKMTNKAVYLLCWLKRYESKLFPKWEMPQIGCVIYLSGCKNENEALFIRLLSRLPVDVLILNPNLNNKCCLEDKMLYEINYTESMNVEKYPCENAEMKMGTAAYHAERELDTLMYQDSGIYRNMQYQKAVSVNLQTMYEEIEILWNQEIKYRPNFSVTEGVVNMPVIMSKVCGIKDGNIKEYWSSIKRLINEDTIVIKKAPYIDSVSFNPMKEFATLFYKNGRLLRNTIKQHNSYRYAYLRDDIQEYMFDKLELLLEQKKIAGTFQNGTEYTIISTVLNMDKTVLRLIQKFDFTRKNPKLIYINTSENILSLEDSILIAFLNLVGFDIVLFVPTGYRTDEKYFNERVVEEHQIGEYIYDLQVPDFDTISSNNHPSWREKIFKRGN